MPENTLYSIYISLLNAYGPQGWWPLLKETPTGFVSYYSRENTLLAKSPEQQFEISLGAVLTQNTTWKNAEKALINLIKNSITTPVKLLDTSNIQLSHLIQPSGYYNQKAKKLQGLAFFLTSGKPITRENLLSLWGLGPETVDDILLYAHQQQYFVVDAYTRRFFSRLGFIKENIPYQDVQDYAQKHLPNDMDVYMEYHALIVAHAKKACSKKPKCGACFLNDLCPHGKNGQLLLL